MADDRVDDICGKDYLPSALSLCSMLGCSSNSKRQRMKTTSREVMNDKDRRVWESPVFLPLKQTVGPENK